MPTKFSLTGSNEGKTVTINDRYAFVDGELVAESDDIAQKLEPILCGYYGCKKEVVEITAPAADTKADASLKAGATKGAKGSADA